MATNQDKKNTTLFQRGRPGTQERATELNNGGATQIVLKYQFVEAMPCKLDPEQSLQDIPKPQKQAPPKC